MSVKQPTVAESIAESMKLPKKIAMWAAVLITAALGLVMPLEFVVKLNVVLALVVLVVLVRRG